MTDLTPLAGLVTLSGLSLDGNQISDVSPLAGLTGLYQLTLHGNHIADLSPLSGLPHATLGNGIAANGQTLSMTAAPGRPTSLPTLTTPAGGGSVTWTVITGAVTLAGTTITAPRNDVAVLRWTDPAGYFTGTVTIAVGTLPAGCVTDLATSAAAPAKLMTQFTLVPDMTGDGRGEILAVDSKGDLWIYPGTTDGGLAYACKIGSGFAGYQVSGPGDTNSDGKPDILGITADGKLWLFAGNGANRLGARQQVGYGWAGWRLVPTGDLNGDAKPDLLGINSQGNLFMFVGKGDGRFQARQQVGSGWTGWKLYAGGDLNGDGKADILGLNSAYNLFQYLGKGNGQFQPRQQTVSGWNWDPTWTLAGGADLDGDGLAELAGRRAIPGGTSTLWILKGLGNATFATPHEVDRNW